MHRDQNNSGDGEHTILERKSSARIEVNSREEELLNAGLDKIDEKFGKIRSRKKSFQGRHKSGRKRINSEAALESSGSHR